MADGTGRPGAASALQDHAVMHCHHLCLLFNRLFLPSHATLLQGGGEEPIYLPATPGQPLHLIRFRHDYFASALHEVAHWCIAGPARRQQVDYGYWYCPDGRNADEQARFEQVEAAPQAVEWLLTLATGARFRLSLDNLNGALSSTRHRFAERVSMHAVRYREQGLPPRAERFARALADHCQQPWPPDRASFDPDRC